MTSQAPSFYFPAPRAQKFCSVCGTALTRRIPPEDNRVRDVCDQCGAIHYQNPRNVVGVVPVYVDRILLCRRAIEPRFGKWTLPAGFMELGETTAQGAMRETQEEAGAQIELGPLYTVIDVPQAEQVPCFYRATVTCVALYPGPESIEAAFFRLEDIPWNELSFRTVSTTLRHYVEDAKTGVFPIHHYDLPERDSQ